MLILVFISGPFKAYAQESETVRKALSFATAKALRIEGLAAHLNVQTVSEPGIRLNLTGSKWQIESILIEETEDAVLIIKAASPATSTTVRITSGSSTVIVNQEGGARINISGNDQSKVITTSAEPPLQATVVLGETTPVSIKGFTGSAVIAARQAPLALELISGDAMLAAVVDADLSISGSGNMIISRASGNLSVAVHGSGDIAVNDTNVAELKVSIFGAGTVQIHGQAEQAELSLSGAGDIYVEAVKQKPQRRLLGVGKIIVANW